MIVEGLEWPRGNERRRREKKGSTQSKNEKGKRKKANDASQPERFMKWNRFPWFHIIRLQNSIHS